MDKEKLTALADLTHTLQFANSMAVVQNISPVIKRKKLAMLKFELVDHSISIFHNFFIEVELSSESLNDLINVCKPGFIVHLQEFQILKSFGVVYGEVSEEDELKLFDEQGHWVKWHSNEEEPVLSEKATSLLKILLGLKSNRSGTTSLNEDSPSLKRKRIKNQTLDKSVDNTSVKESPGDLKQTRHSSASKSNQTMEKNKIEKTSNLQSKEQLNKSSTSLKSLKECPDDFKQTRDTSASKSNATVEKKQNGKTNNLQSRELLNKSIPSPNKKDIDDPTVKDQPPLVHGSRLSRSRSKNSPVSNKKLNSSAEKKGFEKSPVEERPLLVHGSRLSRSRERNSLTKSNKESKRQFPRLCRSRSKNSLDDSNEKLKTIPGRGLRLNEHLSASLPNIDKESQNLQSGELILAKSSKNKILKSIAGHSKSFRSSLRKYSLNKSLQSLKEKDSKSLSSLKRSASLKSLSSNSNDLNQLEENRFLNSSDSSLSSQPISLIAFESIPSSPKQSGRGLSPKKALQSDACPSPSPKRSDSSPAKSSPKNVSKSESNPKASKRKIDKPDSEPQHLSKFPKRREDLIYSPHDKKIRILNPKEESLSLSPSTSKSRNHTTLSKRENENKQLSKKQKDETNSKCSQKAKQNASPVLKLKEKQTRRSLIVNNKTSKPENKKGFDVCRQYLRPFTREVNLKGLSELPETTLDNIEEISVPERVNLECKVISKFSLFEEDIEVIRVVDGSLCPKPMLILTESATWPDLVQTVIDDTKVQKNLPFIDIIILNASRLDYALVINRCYRMKNLNLVKFLLVHGSRPAKETYSNEMFCFGEGQNIYPQTRKIDQEIEKKLQSREIKEAWESLIQAGVIDHALQSVSDSSPKPNNKSEIQKRSVSNTRNDKKRKQNTDEQLNGPASKKPMVTNSKKNKMSEELNSDKPTGIRDSNNLHFVKNISEETLLENTPSVVKELREILVEADDDTMSQSATEDHLKASGSQPTFSEFCRGVDIAKHQIQTSTQASELTENELHVRPNNSDDMSKMDPLVYSPSPSPRSSVSTTSQKTSDFKLQTTTSQKQTDSIVILGVSHATKDVESRIEPEVTKTSTSPSIISSHNSSDDIQLVKMVKGDAPTLRLKQFGVRNKNTNKQTNDSEECCIVSDKNSVETVISEDAVSITSTVENQPFIVDEANYLQVKPENENTKTKINVERFLKALSEKCFTNPHPLNVEGNLHKRGWKTQLGGQPVLSIDAYMKLLQSNCVTFSVKIVSIKPSVADSWREEGIKGRCPDCEQLYTLVEPNSTSSQTALSIGGHLVCPNSECSHQILENPEFHFTLELELKDSSRTIAYIGQHADSLFGCSAQEAALEVQKSSKVYDVLKKINNKIESKNTVKISFTRKDITDPKSGPLFVKELHF